ncbi:MAG: hypothetical protein IT377_12285 [Polyangiaceae bacterium]|nr:hypothetical protein [Polyangiaceae bacterium]
MQRLTLAGLLALACAGGPPARPQPEPAPVPPVTTPSADVATAGEPDAAAPSTDAGADANADATADAGAAADAGATADADDAGTDAPARVCEDAASYVPYVVDLGPAENSARMGPREKSASDEGRPIRATLTAFTAPKELDAFNFATYLPYYVAGAYQDAVATRPGLRGSVRVRLTLDATGKATTVELRAPGFPAAFLDEVRERATTTYAICAPLSAPAVVSATLTLSPRTLRRPGRR